MSDDKINSRKLEILKAIISDYVSTGEPVGSRTLAKKYNLGISSATIRNEMADLEEMGYLEQPHTSSGRVPSSKGYRIYVDELMDSQETIIKNKFEELENEILNFATFEIDKILKQTSVMLSELTNMAIIAETPNVKKCHIKTIQLVSLGSSNIMIVVVLDNQTVKNTIIRLDEVPNAEDLLSLSNYLTLKLMHKTVNDLNIELVKELRDENRLDAKMINNIIKSVYDALNEEGDQYIVEGKSNILNYPEFNDIIKAKEVLNILENPFGLIQKFDDEIAYESDFRILIGDELEIPETRDWSIISAKYRLNGEEVGTINLVGPKRLDYGKVTNILSSVVNELNRKLNNISEDKQDG